MQCPCSSQTDMLPRALKHPPHPVHDDGFVQHGREDMTEIVPVGSLQCTFVTHPLPIRSSNLFAVSQPLSLVPTRLSCAVTFSAQFVYGSERTRVTQAPAVNVTVLGVTLGTPKQVIPPPPPLGERSKSVTKSPFVKFTEPPPKAYPTAVMSTS